MQFLNDSFSTSAGVLAEGSALIMLEFLLSVSVLNKQTSDMRLLLSQHKNAWGCVVMLSLERKNCWLELLLTSG